MGLADDINLRMAEMEAMNKDDDESSPAPDVGTPIPRKRMRQVDEFDLDDGEMSAHDADFSDEDACEFDDDTEKCAETVLVPQPPVRKTAKKSNKDVPLAADLLPEEENPAPRPKKTYLNIKHAWNVMYNSGPGTDGVKITLKHPEYKNYDAFLRKYATAEDNAEPIKKKRKYLVVRAQPEFKPVAAVFEADIEAHRLAMKLWGNAHPKLELKLRAKSAERKKLTANETRNNLPQTQLALVAAPTRTNHAKLIGDANMTKYAYEYRNKMIALDLKADAFYRDIATQRLEAFTEYNIAISNL